MATSPTSLAARIVAGLNIAFAIWGLSLIVRSFAQVSFEDRTFHSVFIFMVGANLVLLVGLLGSALLLLRGSPIAITFSSMVYALEILYFLAISLSWGRSHGPVTNAMVRATGGGNVGIGPQILTAYPLVALVVIRVAAKSRSKSA